MTVINIPLTSLSVGSHDFGPSAVPNGAATVTLAIDRTVTGGLNSLTSSSVLNLTAYQSTDGGATWIGAVMATVPGGIFTMHGGLQVNTSDIGFSLLPSATHAKANIAVSGPSSIAVSGSLTIQ